MNYKDITTAISSVIAAFALRGELWQIIVQAYYHPAWIVTLIAVCLAVFNWWRTRHLIGNLINESYSNYDAAEYWKEQAESERQFYDNLIYDLNNDLQPTLKRVFDWYAKQQSRKAYTGKRRTYRKTR